LLARLPLSGPRTLLPVDDNLRAPVEDAGVVGTDIAGADAGVTSLPVGAAVATAAAASIAAATEEAAKAAAGTAEAELVPGSNCTAGSAAGVAFAAFLADLLGSSPLRGLPRFGLDGVRAG